WYQGRRLHERVQGAVEIGLDRRFADEPVDPHRGGGPGMITGEGDDRARIASLQLQVGQDIGRRHRFVLEIDDGEVEAVMGEPVERVRYGADDHGLAAPAALVLGQNPWNCRMPSAAEAS